MAWKRPGDVFDPDRYFVAEIFDDTTAAEFITSLHYSGSYVAARLRYGLYRVDWPKSRLVGVAVLSVPANRKVLTNVFPGLEPYDESLELGRFVLLEEVPYNAESWFLAEVRRLAAKEHAIKGWVSFSDPVARFTLAGQLVKPGHQGTIYKASNATRAGRSTKRTLILMRDGLVFSARAAQKIRKREQGAEYATRWLMGYGARAPRAFEDPAVWLREVLEDPGMEVRRLPHPGNHRFLFVLGVTKLQRAAVQINPEVVE
jgi:hypothetical protein